MNARILGGVITFFLSLAIGATSGLSCGPGDCRYDPAGCYGAIGAYCNRDAECDTGFCCERDECDDGMCTYACHDDRECPADMLCEHGVCFFSCFDDRDCAPGWDCKHGNRVCER
ncbi:MAG: hypothetical protein KC636_12025 [Myxococcales bacterium]|nr:hypothetical protein [Myxococcales bacterium]